MLLGLLQMDSVLWEASGLLFPQLPLLPLPPLFFLLNFLLSVAGLERLA